MSQRQQILPISDFIESLDYDDAFTHLTENYNLQDNRTSRVF